MFSARMRLKEVKRQDECGRGLTAPRLAQLDKRRSAEREVVGSNPGRANTKGRKKTEDNVLPLL